MKMLVHLNRSIDHRSRGSEAKKKAYILQYVSAVLFFIMGMTLAISKSDILLALFFMSEGLGQYFLAAENRDSLLVKKDDLITYFTRSRRGFLAALFFSITMICRYKWASTFFYPYHATVFFGGIILTLMYLALYHFYPLKRETLSGVSGGMILFSSQLLVGGALWAQMPQGFYSILALNQLLYSLLLVMGLLFLRPWVAEALNIALWTILFFSVMV